MKSIFIYVTAPSEDWAVATGKKMVEEKLAACGNILPGMTSVYRWKDKVEQSQEAILILKTRESLFSDVENRIKELHPYDLPCIVALPIERGHQPFLNWLEKETQK